MPGDLSELLPICDHNELYNNIDSFQHVEAFEHGEYQAVELIDTTDGKFIEKSEAGWMDLSGSALLVGVK